MMKRRADRDCIERFVRKRHRQGISDLKTDRPLALELLGERIRPGPGDVDPNDLVVARELVDEGPDEAAAAGCDVQDPPAMDAVQQIGVRNESTLMRRIRAAKSGTSGPPMPSTHSRLMALACRIRGGSQPI